MPGRGIPRGSCDWRCILDEPGLRDRLAAAAKPSVKALSTDMVYGKLEALGGGRGMTERPRVLFVGRARYTLPPPGREEMGRGGAESLPL